MVTPPTGVTALQSRWQVQRLQVGPERQIDRLLGDQAHTPRRQERVQRSTIEESNQKDFHQITEETDDEEGSGNGEEEQTTIR